MVAATALHDVFEGQIAACRQLGSPFTAELLDILLRQAQRGGVLAEMLAAWSGDPVADALLLRLAGSLHALVLSEATPGLKACYPGGPLEGDGQALQAAVDSALVEHRTHIEHYLLSPPQTNEPMRSAVLLGGFLTIAHETQQPLRLLEIGASAGLNMIWDCYRYELGDLSFGRHDSPVLLKADWSGSLPAATMPEIKSRAACDRAPIDLRDPEQQTRLRSYVWADQRLRLARLDGAIKLAVELGIEVDRADAGDWLARQLENAVDGVATVVYHSVMWQYLPTATQQRVTALIDRAGRRTMPHAPLAWLRFEPRPDFASYELRLSLWQSGQRGDRLLALAHPHGTRIDWLAD